MKIWIWRNVLFIKYYLRLNKIQSKRIASNIRKYLTIGTLTEGKQQKGTEEQEKGDTAQNRKLTKFGLNSKQRRQQKNQGGRKVRQRIREKSWKTKNTGIFAPMRHSKENKHPTNHQKKWEERTKTNKYGGTEV